MLKSVAFANAATVVTAVFYMVCVLLTYVAPDMLYSLAQSWVHSLSLQSLRSTAQLSVGTAVLGLITLSFITWITTYAVIELYNRFVK